MSYWACVQLEPNRERLALLCLSTVHGFEVYSPRIRPERPRNADDTRALFPGYAFILIVLQWHAARWSPGVVRVVLDGAVPAKVHDQVFAEIRARERSGVVELPCPPQPKDGDHVRILGGPFRGCLALYAGMKPRERVEVLLSLLGAQQRVTLPHAAIEVVCAGD